jgi:hypothetical protein
MVETAVNVIASPTVMVIAASPKPASAPPVIAVAMRAPIRSRILRLFSFLCVSLIMSTSTPSRWRQLVAQLGSDARAALIEA